MRYTKWHKNQKSTNVETKNHEFEVTYIEEGSGEPVTVFLHGIPTWGFLFREVYDCVEHAVVPDLAGWGYTENTKYSEYDRSVAVQEVLISNLVEKLGFDSVQLVGHDVGGSVCLRLAVYTDLVERMVLSNIGSYDSWPVKSVQDMGLPENAGGMEWTQEKVKETIEKMLENGTSKGKDTEEFVNGMKGPFTDGPRKKNDISRNSSAFNVNHTSELTPHLNEIEAPTFLLWGAEDIFQPPKWSNKLSQDIPKTQKKYLTAHHWLMQDKPVKYRSEIEKFLN